MPTSWIGLCALAVGLGVRHGFDADHLTVIDAVVRRNLLCRPVVARLAGCLFAAGHGLVVLVAAVMTTTVAAQWRMPAWLNLAGALSSIVVLLVLAIANLSAALGSPRDRDVAPVGMRSRLFPAAGRADHPFAIMLTGFVFALSFDTLAQAVALSLAGSGVGGSTAALMAVGCFVAGIFVSTGLSGVWVAHMIAVAHRRTAAASRLMVFVIGMLNLTIGTLAMLRLVSSEIDAWGAEHELLASMLVVSVVVAAFVLATTFGRRNAPSAAGDARWGGLARRRNPISGSSLAEDTREPAGRIALD